MANKSIEITANSEIELLTKIKAINEILTLKTDELKRLSILSKNQKAKEYLSSELKFLGLIGSLKMM